jgi:hypothetical protein
MVSKAKLGKDGSKPTMGSKSLRQLLNGKLGKKRNHCQVRFQSFFSAWPPLYGRPQKFDLTYPAEIISPNAWSRYRYRTPSFSFSPCGRNEWERYVNYVIPSIILHLISDKIAFAEPYLANPWTRHFPDEKHDYVEEKDYHINLSFSDATHSIYEGKLVNTDHLYTNLILPIACSFIHKTAWKKRLVSFEKESGAWVKEIEKLSHVYCNCLNLGNLIYDEASEDWDEDPDSNYFWKGWNDSEGQLREQFIVTFNFFVTGIVDLIKELDRTFSEAPPASLDVIINRRKWEILVVDWVRKEKEYGAWLFLYATKGEILYFRNYLRDFRPGVIYWKYW